MGQKMSWEEIRKAYPETYVLLKDYLQEESAKDKVRIINGEVIFVSSNSQEVYHHYKEHKKEEIVIFAYTGWPVFEVEKKPSLGIRFSHE